MEMLDWFEWNGVRCTDYGMHALSQPSIISPNERVNSETVPGRAGSLTILEGDNVFENMTLSCSCVIDDPYQMMDGEKVSRIAKITGWLRGYGNVKFANRQEGFYRARLANQIEFAKIVQGNPHMSFQVHALSPPASRAPSARPRRRVERRDRPRSTCAGCARNCDTRRCA